MVNVTKKKGKKVESTKNFYEPLSAISLYRLLGIAFGLACLEILVACVFATRTLENRQKL